MNSIGIDRQMGNFSVLAQARSIDVILLFEALSYFPYDTLAPLLSCDLSSEGLVLVCSCVKPLDTSVFKLPSMCQPVLSPPC